MGIRLHPPPPAADYLKLPPASATDSFSGTSGTTDPDWEEVPDPDWEEVPETILGPPPPVADYLKGPPTLATDGFSGTAERFLGATHELKVPETNSDSIAEHGQVLEIPQAVNAALVERMKRRQGFRRVLTRTTRTGCARATAPLLRYASVPRREIAPPGSVPSVVTP